MKRGLRRRSTSAKTARQVTANAALFVRNVRQSMELATAAATVIQRRAAKSDHDELARFVPEKLNAFASAGLQATRHMAVGALWWNTLAAQRGLAIARAAASGKSALGFWAWPRMVSTALDASAKLMRAQYAMRVPVLRTAKANAVRLTRV